MKNDLSKAKRLIKECFESKNPYLELGNCGINDLNNLPELFMCRHLKVLVLSNRWWDQNSYTWKKSQNHGYQNIISFIPKKIQRLQSLHTLIIAGDTSTSWRISSIKPLEYLRELKYLDIGFNNIADIHPVAKLINLETFNMRRNKVSNISSLYKLKNLEVLNLASNYLRNIKPLVRLENLTELYLGSNRVWKLDSLGKLFKLKILYLNDNEIYDINPLKSLWKLEILNLRFNQINQLQPLKNLRNLKYLLLRSNKIEGIEFLSGLRNLTRLELDKNNISDIESFPHLKRLKYLNLADNRLKIIPEINKLSTLEELNLNNNKIFKLDNLSNLKDLIRLEISSNLIESIEPLVSLKNLEYIDLKNNRINELSLKFLINFDKKVDMGHHFSENLQLYNNPIQTPPIEIVQQGRQAMLDWYNANKKKLAEIKVILIGDPKSGKTSLLKKLKYDDFNENEPQTDGINIEDVVFAECKTFEEYKTLNRLTAHFWDFGGQEIMNATHQFFLTNRSIYVLVLDARKDSHVSTQVRQWVKRIQNTSGKSSIIVVANQIDVNPGFGFENERELQEEFPEIKYFIKASCKEGTEIATIKEKLAELIPQAELFDTEIDERWINIKEKLQQELDAKEEKYLDEKRFNEICGEFTLDVVKQRLNAIQFLHDLGILLHFKEIDSHTYFVLDPYWITYGVYQILTSKKAGELNGLIPMSELDYIINIEEDKKESYHPAKLERIKYLNNDRHFLVEVLNQFKLCFYQPDKKKFIIPDLLSTVEPSSKTKKVREAKGSIHFVYEYEYLLKSIMPRIMVEQHILIKERWRTGCVLEKGNCQALISSYQHRITISVAGEHPEKREFMSILRHQLDTINSTLTDKPDMLIPLPGTKEFADYDILLDMEKDGEQYYTLRKPIKKKYLISELLEGIERKDRYQHFDEKLDEILGNQKDAKKEMSEIIDNQQVIISQLHEQYNYLINQPGNEELQEKLLNEMAKLNDRQTEAIADSMMEMISLQFEQSEEMIDEKLTEVYENLQKTSNHELKLKLSVPVLKQLGVDLSYQFNIRKWSLEMYEKYSWPLFKLLGGFK